METIKSALANYSDKEKSAYLGTLAALATANRGPSVDELKYLTEISEAAGIDADYQERIVQAANDVSCNDLKNCLEVLKTSELRFSLITDLIALAKVDDDYSEKEKENIEKVSRYLNVTTDQFSALDDYVSHASQNTQGEAQPAANGFFNSPSMKQKFQNAGFNLDGMGKNLLGILGPVLLGGLAAKSLGRNSGMGRGLGGGLLGGLLGNRMGGLGGLGGLMSGLNNSRTSGNMGGLLGKLFR